MNSRCAYETHFASQRPNIAHWLWLIVLLPTIAAHSSPLPWVQYYHGNMFQHNCLQSAEMPHHRTVLSRKLCLYPLRSLIKTEFCVFHQKYCIIDFDVTKNYHCVITSMLINLMSLSQPIFSGQNTLKQMCTYVVNTMVEQRTALTLGM